MELKDYLKILYRRRLWVVATLILFFVLFFSYAVYERQYYQTTSKILLRRSDPILSVMGVMTYAPKVLSYRTQMSVATSTAVCERTAAKLKGRVTPDEIRQAVSLRQEPETEIVHVTVSYEDPALAIGIANALIEEFAAYDDEQVKQSANNAIDFLTQEIRRINEDEVPKIEKELKEFRKERGVFDVSEQIRMDLKRLAELEGADQELDAKIQEADIEVQSMESEISRFIDSCKKIIRDKAGHMPRDKLVREILGEQEFPSEEMLENMKERIVAASGGSSGNLRVRGIEERAADAAIEKRSLLARYTENHPDVVAQDRLILGLEEMRQTALEQDDVERALRRRFSKYDKLLSMQANLAALKQRRERSVKLAEQLRNRLGSISDAEIQYMNLNRQFTQGKERLATWVAKRADLELEKTRISGNVSVYEKALPGSFAKVPKKSMDSFPLFLMMALVTSVGIAYLTDVMDTTLRTDYHVNRYLNLPVLGVIPYVDEKEDRLIVHQPMKNLLMEDFSRLATFFPAQFEETGGKVFMIVSYREEEGKSTTLSNLAVAFARNGYSVVLLDADMRKPKLHEFFEVPIHPGLSTLLDGTLAAEDRARQLAAGAEPKEPADQAGRALVRPGIWKGEGLYLMPSGTIPENPAGLLRSDSCMQLLDEIRDSADVILIDVPPLVGAADALVLAPWVDGVIYLIEAGATTKEESTHGKRMVENAGGAIIGCILNKAREVESASYYYYARGYRYYRRHYGGYGSYAR